MKRFGTLILASLVVSAFALSQPGQTEQPAAPGQSERGWERVEQLRKVRLIEMLDLKEEQSVRFFARHKEHDAARRELMKKKEEALDKIERLLRNRADASELTAVFADVEALEGQLLAERRKFLESLQDILSVEQRARFILFERRFERELRDAFRESQRRRHRAEEP